MLKTVHSHIKKVRSIREKSPSHIEFKHLDRAREIALYYGFNPIQPPEVLKSDVKDASGLENSSIKEKEDIAIHTEERIALLRTYTDGNLQSQGQPLMVAYHGSSKESRQKKKDPKERRVTLEILGSGKSIAEALLIRTAFAILEEEGYEDLTVELNSLGDKDSLNRFMRELTLYYKKNAETMPGVCKQIFKKDVFQIICCDHEKCQDVKENAPHPISYLTEPSRIHFKELLEYFESNGICYSLHNNLVVNATYCTHSAFLIRGKEKGSEEKICLAVGCRYNSLAKKIGMKREVPAVGLTLTYPKKHKEEIPAVRRIKKPHLYFIHMGFEAKLKSLAIIEMLRKVKILIYHSLTRDKLQAQMTSAETLRIPYVLIMGQKESMENSIVVRHAATRAQETVKIDDLTEYVRKILD